MMRTSMTGLLGMVLLSGVALAGNTPDSAFNRDPWPMAKTGPVKVFILCGQSNMQGHAALRTLEYLIYNPQTAEEYQQWKDRYGLWNERRDVWIYTTDGHRYGNLKPGYGGSDKEIGPELGFGWVMGEKLDDQVLIIKTCWGGRSVKKDFLSPSAEMPSDAFFQKELARRRERELRNLKKRHPNATLADVNLTIADIKQAYGKAYRDTLATTREVLGNLKKYFPQYDAKRGYELAGFVFFQGWNDMIDGQQRAEKYATYTKRLATMIQDFRKDLNAPNLPVVIGELGACQRGDFQAAQQAVTKQPGMTGVAFVKTRDFWEPQVEKMVNEDVWKGKDWVRFYNVGSERGYHYLGSAKMLYKIGKAFANGMLELMQNP